MRDQVQGIGLQDIGVGGDDARAGRVATGPGTAPGTGCPWASSQSRGRPLEESPSRGGRPTGKGYRCRRAARPGTFHFTFRLRSFDGTPLAASFYPSKLGSAAPVVMLIHEMGRSRKDFEDAVLELKGQGLGRASPGAGLCRLHHGPPLARPEPARALSADERPRLMEDLQAGYFFLVDRHNRGDLNLAKLGVIALGDGANLVAGWAFQPGAAITIEGRPSDLNALVLISPKPEGFGYVLGHVVAPLAPRIPLFLLAGERDVPSEGCRAVGPPDGASGAAQQGRVRSPHRFTATSYCGSSPKSRQPLSASSTPHSKTVPPNGNRNTT